MKFSFTVIRPQPSATFNVCNFAGLRLLTRLRLGISHLNEHRFTHNFQNCINPLCTCSLKVEPTSHFFLHCLRYNDIRATLLNDLKSVDQNILKLSGNKVIYLLLYGDLQLDSNKNSRLLNAAIKYIIDSGRFPVPLANVGVSLSTFFYFVLFIYLFILFENMTELFITLFSPVFIYYISHKFNITYVC